MEKLVEQQREHFNEISELYSRARKHPNHLRLKELIWQGFLKRNSALGATVKRVLEPMCGMAEGHQILRLNWAAKFDYLGFDYSEKMVGFARQAFPSLDIQWGDVTTYQHRGELVDLIVLISGLHHVYQRTDEVIANLAKSLRPKGYFLSFEPTQNNALTSMMRNRIYQQNALFDAESERGYEYSDLQQHFKQAGFSKVDEVYPGLLAYVLYYNPDAFPWLNRGGTSLVRAAFALDRLLWRNAVGRKLSFATITLWQWQK